MHCDTQENRKQVSQLTDFMKSNGMHDVEITCVSNPLATFKSFKLAVPIKDKEKVMNEDVWPCGICIQRWKSFKKPAEVTKHSDGS